MFEAQSFDNIEGSLTKSLKIRLKIIVKLTDNTYDCNSLTNFEYKAVNAIAGNEYYFNLL